LTIDISTQIGKILATQAPLCTRSIPTNAEVNYMKLSLHQQIALFWMFAAPGVFWLVIENATRPDAGAVIAWGIAIVAAMILSTPLLLRWSTFRRWYGWTDALSDWQRQALTQRNLRRYYQIAFDEGYVFRMTPYMWRISWTVGGLMVVITVLPSTGQPALDALILFSNFYPIGVILLVIASLPLGQIVRARVQRRK
jgi:hypothetical protein